MSDDDDDRMSGAELQIWLDLLGLSHDVAAEVLSVRQDTVRRWCSDRDPLPYRVADEIAEIDAYTARAIGELVSRLRDDRDPEAEIYRHDSTLWEGVPELKPLGARWWRMVVARASLEVPGLAVCWADEREPITPPTQ